jgi:hypothetical protein
MAVTRRPKPALVAATPPVDVEALINKGGSVARAGAEPTAPAKTASVVLRLPPDVLARVDRAEGPAGEGAAPHMVDGSGDREVGAGSLKMRGP